MAIVTSGELHGWVITVIIQVNVRGVREVGETTGSFTSNRISGSLIIAINKVANKMLIWFIVCPFSVCEYYM